MNKHYTGGLQKTDISYILPSSNVAMVKMVNEIYTHIHTHTHIYIS
jgi:hypothetical protein